MTALAFFVAVGAIIGAGIVGPVAYCRGHAAGRAARVDAELARISRTAAQLERIGGRQIAAERARLLPECSFFDYQAGEPDRCGRG